MSREDSFFSSSFFFYSFLLFKLHFVVVVLFFSQKWIFPYEERRNKLYCLPYVLRENDMYGMYERRRGGKKGENHIII